jgi:tetratricopeptide (TPR) repeat protein
VAITLVALLGLGVTVSGIWWMYSSGQERARMAQEDVLRQVEPARSLDAPAEVKANGIRELEALLVAHPSGPVVGRAAYELGSLRQETGQLAAARSAYEIVVARASTTTLRTLARASIASTWEAERNFEAAARVLNLALSEIRASDFLFDVLLLDLARVHGLAGQRDSAVATYKRLLREAPSSPRADEARTRLAALGVHP